MKTVKKNSKTGILSDLRMLKHRSKPRHPEAPARVKAILNMLEEKEILSHPRVHYLSQYDRMASDDDIRLIYSQKYVDYLRKLWPEGEDRLSISISDSYCNPHTEMAARVSAGGVLEGIDRIMSGEWANGFCVVRPPGHHSGEKGSINGFCVLNNVAMGARYL
jgi:histone deacetylase 6